MKASGATSLWFTARIVCPDLSGREEEIGYGAERLEELVALALRPLGPAFWQLFYLRGNSAWDLACPSTTCAGARKVSGGGSPEPS
jgi:hypothetical protein